MSLRRIALALSVTAAGVLATSASAAALSITVTNTTIGFTVVTDPFYPCASVQLDNDPTTVFQMCAAAAPATFSRRYLPALRFTS